MPKLVFTESKFAGREYEFVREKTAIGRADDNLLVIRDPSVSSHHCEVVVNGTEVIVRDLGSRNGTFVNGTRLVSQQSQVKSGGTVRFGTVEARVEIDFAGARDDATEITAIYSHGRALRDQREAKSAPPANPAMKLEAAEVDLPAERTILMANSSTPSPRPGETDMATKPATPSPGAAHEPQSRLWIGLLLAAVVAGVAVWWIWFRR